MAQPGLLHILRHGLKLTYSYIVGDYFPFSLFDPSCSNRTGPISECVVCCHWGRPQLRRIGVPMAKNKPGGRTGNAIADFELLFINHLYCINSFKDDKLYKNGLQSLFKSHWITIFYSLVFI